MRFDHASNGDVGRGDGCQRLPGARCAPGSALGSTPDNAASIRARIAGAETCAMVRARAARKAGVENRPSSSCSISSTGAAVTGSQPSREPMPVSTGSGPRTKLQQRTSPLSRAAPEAAIDTAIGPEKDSPRIT